MAKGSNQKLKLSYLKKIMLEKTDDDHGLTMPQIIEELEKYEVTAERKSIYTDLEDLEKLGVEIIKEKNGREHLYHVGGRLFELAEIKLIIDTIQASKFITERKSRQLIEKLKSLVSKYEAQQLSRQIYVHGRIKTQNESIYYNVDYIHNAINNNKKIQFKYYKWDINKELILKNKGNAFVVSPWALTWDDENYYMVAYDDFSGKIKHYRVDKMTGISVTEQSRDGKELFENFDITSYSKKNFGMYGGVNKRICIEFPDYLCGVFIDRFGKDIEFREVDDSHHKFYVSVAISPQFFGWIFSLGKEVKVTEPEDIVLEMKQYLADIAKNY
ncbi:MAG: WYL domain-containing protein [Butyrivibrio sp.]|nr:WYL domain-containing protein [Butyrivibrio sp.]